MNKQLFLLLCVGSCLFCWPLQQCIGQQVTYAAQNKPVTDILDEISTQYEVFFSYPSKLLSPYTATLEVTDEPLESFLRKLLNPYGLVARKSKEKFYFIARRKRRVMIRIKEYGTNDPLAYATARLINSNKGAYADGDGDALLTFEPGKDSLCLVRYIGFADQLIRLGMQTKDTLDVFLRQDEVALEEVVIEYNNDAITLREASLYDIRLPGLKVLPGLPEADVLLSVQMLPGIESNDETASGINVRGGGSDELLVYWDRIPVYQQAHFFGTLTSFIPSTVEHITAFKNYIPTQYGGATSGLLEIRMFDSIPEVVQVISNSNFTHSDLMVRVPFKEKVALMVAGRLSYNNQFNSPTFVSHQNKLFSGTTQEDILDNLREADEEEEDTGLKDLTQLSYNDLNGKIILNLTPRDYISISAMYNRDDFFFDAQAQESSLLVERAHEVTFTGANFWYERTWSPDWKSSVSASQSDYVMDNLDKGIFDDGETNFETNISNSLHNTELKGAVTYSGFDDMTLEAGYQFNDYQNFLNYIEVDEFGENFEDTLETAQQAHAAFLRYHYSKADKIDIQPQLRVDYYPNLDQVVVNPVLNIQYKPFANTWLKAAYGQYAQALRSMREGDLDVSNVSESVWILADDEDITLLQSRQLSVGALYAHKGLLVDLDLYWKQTQGMSALNQFEEVEELEFTSGRANGYGMDLMVRKKFGRYQTWVSYSLGKVENTFSELQNDPFPSSFDRRHQLRWAHNLYAGPVEFSLGWTYKSGSPFTQPVGIREMVDDNNETFYEIEFEALNQSRLPQYHRLDLSVWYNFARTKWGFYGTLGFAIQNIYNRQNVWKRFYFLEDVDDDDIPEVVEEERYFLGFTPNVSLKLRFN